VRKLLLTLLTDDPALRVAVAAMLRRHPQSFDLSCLAFRDAMLTLKDAQTDLVVIDSDAASDPLTSVAVAALVQPAPIVVLGTAAGRDEAFETACFTHGAAAVIAKASGPAAPGLAGPEGDAFMSKVALLVGSANEVAS
jgi:DNA-binding NarL/FixJ family response regulator